MEENSLVRKSLGKRIVVFGPYVPDEIFLSFGIRPHRIFGGNHYLAETYGGSLPRDTDAMSRSIYGTFVSYGERPRKVVVPLVNDSAKKQAYLLKREGFDVYTITMPPVKDKAHLPEYKRQMEGLIMELETISHRLFSERRLKRAGKEIFEAKQQLAIFDQLCKSHEESVSSLWRLFIPLTMHSECPVSAWTEKLKNHNKEIAGMHGDSGKRKNNILLAGSPVVFPNFKVPILLEKHGLSFGGNFISTDITSPYNGDGSFDDFCIRSFVNDASPSYARNSTLCKRTEAYLNDNGVLGVVFLVIKGQIEYDFELERMEKTFSGKKIPVIRLETDYNRQDIEQLSLRVEAFSEMLTKMRI